MSSQKWGDLDSGFVSPSESLTAVAKYLVVKLSFKDQDTRLLETLFKIKKKNFKLNGEN